MVTDVAARPSTEAWLLVDTGFFDDGIEFTESPRRRIPVVQIGSATGGKAYLGAGIYHEPRVRSYNDKAPVSTGNNKEISFSVLLQGESTMDEVLKDWEIIENLLNRAVDASGPHPRGTGVIYVERLHDSSRYAAWDVQSGFLTGVDLGIPGDPFWGAVVQLAVLPGARLGPGFTPRIIDFGATVVNGPQGHLYIPDVEGDFYSCFEARIRDNSDGGTVITRMHAGRRNYLTMGPTEFTPAFYANDSIVTSLSWQQVSQFQNPAGSQQFGLLHALLLVKDHSVVLTKPAQASAISFHGGRVPNVERSYFVSAAATGKESAPSPAASLGIDPTAVDVLTSSSFEEAVPLSAAAWQVSSDAREGKTVRWTTASKDDGTHGLYITPNDLGISSGGGGGSVLVISFGATFYSPLLPENFFPPNTYPHLPLTITARVRALTAGRFAYVTIGPLVAISGHVSFPVAGTGDLPVDGAFHDVELTISASSSTINSYKYAMTVDGNPLTFSAPSVGPIAALETNFSISAMGFGGDTAPGDIEFYLGHYKVVDATGTVFETNFSDLTDVAYWTRLLPSIGSEATIAVIPDPLDASNHVLSVDAFTDFGAVNASIVNSRAVPPGVTQSGKFAVVNTMGLTALNLPSVASAGILNGQSDNFAAYLFGGMLLNRGSIRGWTIDDNTFFQIPDDGSRHEYKFIVTSAGGSMSFTAPFTVDLFVDGIQQGHRTNLLTLPPLTALSLGVNAPTAAAQLSVVFDDWLELDNDYTDINIVGIRDALSWSPSPAATTYNLYLQEGGITLVLANVGNVTNFAVSDISAWVKTDGLPIGENAGSFAQVRARVATGHNPVRSTPLDSEAVQTQRANGQLEMIKVAQPSLPPQARAEGQQTSRDWTLFIDVRTASGTGAEIEILGLWLMPADEEGWTGITATAYGLTQQCEWHFGTNRFGYSYCELLDKNTGEVIGSAEVTGKLALKAGDNIVPFLAETDDGQGKPVGNRTTAKFSMGGQFVETWHWNPAVGPPV